MSPRRLAVVGILSAMLPATAAAEAPAVRARDAKAYPFLKAAKRLPPLDRGDPERTLTAVAWHPSADRADDPAYTGRTANRQLLEAVCGADLVVIARVESSVPFRHPDDRWVLTSHELAVSRVLRVRSPREAGPRRLQYVHPSGVLAGAARTVRAAVDRFPPIESDEDALFFLVQIDGRRYRTSFVLPPMALRGGVLDGLGTAAADAPREPAAGYPARDAMRLAADAICRPAAIERPRRPRSTDGGRLPPLGLPSRSPLGPP